MSTNENANLLNAKLGKTIRKYREKLGISQEKLANIAALDRTYIGGVERGERNITINSLKRISDALEVKMSDLLKDCEE